MCAADDTLETSGFSKNFKGVLVEGIDGMNQSHQCRNSTQLWHAVNDSELVPRKSELLGQNTVFPVPGRDREGKPWVTSES
jgi:hypothetical protein